MRLTEEPRTVDARGDVGMQTSPSPWQPRMPSPWWKYQDWRWDVAASSCVKGQRDGTACYPFPSRAHANTWKELGLALSEPTCCVNAGVYRPENKLIFCNCLLLYAQSSKKKHSYHGVKGHPLATLVHCTQRVKGHRWLCHCADPSFALQLQGASASHLLTLCISIKHPKASFSKLWRYLD